MWNLEFRGQMLVPITGIIYLRFTISEFYFKAWRYIGQLRRHFSTITKQSPETKKNVLMNEGAVVQAFK